MATRIRPVIWHVVIILGLWVITVSGQPAPPWLAVFGNLHAHTGVSDGVEAPSVAYQWAQKEGRIDFLCLSEHNHLSQQSGLDGAVKAAEAATSATFVGFVGQEFSTIEGGNHLNLHDVSERVPADMNSNYRALYRTWLPAYVAAHPSSIVVVQFNHPDNISKDYGIAPVNGFQNYNGDWEAFVEDADPWVSLIAVITGPADSNMPKNQTAPRDEHRDMDSARVRRWHQYLDKGFHLSPVADQDNHRKSWGSRTRARTGVWIQGAITRAGLLTALKDGRTFATEDPNLKIWFTVNGEPMGKVLPGAQASDLAIAVHVEDGDEPGSRYIVRLFREIPGDGELPLMIDESDAINNGATWTTTVEHLENTSEALMAFVTQVSSDAHIDDAWTAPIWISAAASPITDDSPATDAPAFVRSRNSRVYHVPTCAIARQIEENGNLIPHTPVEGDGTRLHKNCPQ